MRQDHEDTQSAVYFTNGNIALWRWLGLDRFFPPDQPMQTVLRGCASVRVVYIRFDE
jgi:polycomb protein EED